MIGALKFILKRTAYGPGEIKWAEIMVGCPKRKVFFNIDSLHTHTHTHTSAIKWKDSMEKYVHNEHAATLKIIETISVVVVS